MDQAKKGNAHEGGRQSGDRDPAVHQAEAGANQGVEGVLEGLIAHTGAAKDDAPHIRLTPLQRSPVSPGSTCLKKNVFVFIPGMEKKLRCTHFDSCILGSRTLAET